MMNRLDVERYPDNGLDTRVGKVDSAGTATYRRTGVGVTDSVLNDGSAAYTPGISQRRSGVTTYDLNDRLGTASRQTDRSATTTATRTYAPSACYSPAQARPRVRSASPEATGTKKI